MTDAARPADPAAAVGAPDQSDVRPLDRQIGVGVRTDGPNGQSSTPQEPTDSILELLGSGERATALPDEGVEPS